MTRVSRLVPEFVELAPPELKEGVLYVSMVYGSAVHKCCCGCGEKVVTPFSPTDWKLAFDGETVSLHPSIGNWGFKCRSHYWIRENEVHWAPQWSEAQIKAGRLHDRNAKLRYFGHRDLKPHSASSQDGPDGKEAQPRSGWQTIQSGAKVFLQRLICRK
jgi:hypothetical protein